MVRILLLILLSAAATLLPAADFSNASIVVAADASGSVRYAAERLRHYIEKGTGLLLPVVTDREAGDSPRFLVGPSRFTRAAGIDPAAFAEQEYRIVTVGGDLALLGRDGEAAHFPGNTFCNSLVFQEIGTVYAVNDFLMRVLGVRWFLPTELGEVVPPSAGLEVPELHIRRSPSVKHRNIHGYCWLRDIPRYFEVKFNDEFGVPAGPFLSFDESLDWARALKMGGRPFSGGHGQMDYLGRFGETHPDWFANASPEEGGQLCYSSPGLFRQVVQDARDFFDGHFTGTVTFSCGDYFSVMPGDNQAWCRCQACRKWFEELPRDVFAAPPRNYASAYVWHFVSEVAREVAKTHPRGNIVCCAYADYLLPPEEIELPPNVTVFLCSSHGETPDAASAGKREAWVRSWAEKTGNIVFWDYYLFPVAPTFERFMSFQPHTIDRQIKLMRQLGLDSGFMAQTSETVIRNLAIDHLRIYLTCMLLDDWDRDVDLLLDEYYRLFYGPAEAPMRAFWTALEEIYTRPRPESREYRDAEYDWMVMVGEDDLAGLRRCLDEALRIADGVYRQRVELIEAGVLDLMLEGRRRVLAQIEATRRASIPLLAAPGELTGDLTHPAWQEATVLDGWSAINGGPEPGEVATTAYVFRTAADLYLGFRCLEPDMGGLRTERSRHDDTWLFRDDSLEIFLDPGRGLDEKHYFHLLVNADGVCRDSFCRNGSDWEAQADIAVKRSAAGWTMEVRLPLASMRVETIAPGECWGMNFCRNRPVRRQDPSAMQNENYDFYNWNGPWGYHNPMRFGILEFK